MQKVPIRGLLTQLLPLVIHGQSFPSLPHQLPHVLVLF